MLRRVRERDFQRAIVELAQRLGWRIMHISESTKRVRRGGRYITVPDPLCQGWPDLVLVHEHAKVTLFRELKTNAGTLTDPQREWLAALDAAGHDADVWRPRDWDTVIVPTLQRKQP